MLLTSQDLVVYNLTWPGDETNVLCKKCRYVRERSSLDQLCINGFVFYANIVGSNQAVFFLTQSNTYIEFLRVFGSI